MEQEPDDHQAPWPAMEPANQGNFSRPPEIDLDLQGRRTVLVICNKRTICQLIQIALQREHINAIAITKYNRDIILTTIAKEKPGLIILDSTLLRTDKGKQTSQAIHNSAQTNHTPIIVLVPPYQNTFDKMRARLIGASDYLIGPPFKATEVKTLVKHYLQ